MNALAGRWDVLDNTPFPEDLQWESLVDVLRGRVKVGDSFVYPSVARMMLNHI